MFLYVNRYYIMANNTNTGTLFEIYGKLVGDSTTTFILKDKYSSEEEAREAGRKAEKEGNFFRIMVKSWDVRKVKEQQP